MSFLETARLRIHYQDAGSGPEAFVLVHGNFASWRWWRPVLERLRPGWKAVAPDLRGCGETPGGVPGAGRSAYAIEQLADDLAGFVDAYGLDSFHLVGHSLGGAVALQYALTHQKRVRSLLLAAPPPPAGLPAMRKGNSKSARLLRTVDPGHGPSMDALHSSVRIHRSLGTNRWMLRRALPRMMPAAVLDPLLTESMLSDAARMSPDAVVGFLQGLHRWNVQAELPRLRVPTVVVWGAKDETVPRAGLEEMVKLLPSAELVVWSEAGHSPQLEQPDAFIALLATSARRPVRKRLGRWLSRAKNWCAATLKA